MHTGIKTALIILITFSVAGAGMLDPDSLAFGPIRVDLDASDTLRIWNTGTSDLFVDGGTLASSQFKILNTPFSGAPIRVPPAEAFELVVRFEPGQTGTFAEMLQIDTDAGSLPVPLTGEGVETVIVINEILADPPSGEAGDANGDGVRNSNHDEFVELLNIGRFAVDLSGIQLFDQGSSASNRFSFPNGTLLPGYARIVLFGGGTPAGMGSLVFVDDGKIGGGLRNSGDVLILLDSITGDTLSTVGYGSEGGKDQSLVRYPEGTGEFLLHSEFPGTGNRFSPGISRSTLSRIEITPRDTSISLGDEVQFTAVGFFPDNTSLVLEQLAQWTSANDEILLISDGVGIGRGTGVAAITATAGGILSETTTIEVVAPGIGLIRVAPQDTSVLVGDTVSFRVAGVKDGGLEMLIETGIRWASGDSSVLSIQETGLVQAISPGRSHVAAIWEQFMGEAIVTALAWGDLNTDGTLDILDAVRTVHLIIGREPAATPFEHRSSDLNQDSVTDILDLSILIGRILGRPVAGSKPAMLAESTWYLEGNALVLHTTHSIAVLYLELSSAGSPICFMGTGSYRFLQDADATNQNLLIYSVEPFGIPSSEGEIRFQTDQAEKNVNGLSIASVSGVDLYNRRIEFSDRNARRFRLSRIHPNPFNTTTVIRYELDEEREILLRVFNAIGQEITTLANGLLPVGKHHVFWEGRDRQGNELSSGVYLACLESGTDRSVEKLMLLK